MVRAGWGQQWTKPLRDGGGGSRPTNGTISSHLRTLGEELSDASAGKPEIFDLLLVPSLLGSCASFFHVLFNSRADRLEVFRHCCRDDQIV